MKQINMQHNAKLYDSLGLYHKSFVIIVKNLEMIKSPGQLLLTKLHDILIDWTKTF